MYDRFRRRETDHAGVCAYQPPVAVLIPAYNEEKVMSSRRSWPF